MPNSDDDWEPETPRDSTVIPGRSLAGAKVLVTGGGGLVGSHIVDLLLDEGCAEIVVLDSFLRGRRENLVHALANGPVKVVEGDIRDRALMDFLVRSSDFVSHQAALRITQCAAEPRLAMEIMVNSAYDLFDACARHGIRKIVSASSASIYGMAGHFPTAEDHHPYSDRTLYGIAKTFNEGLGRVFWDSHRLECVCLRYFNVFGPRMDTHGKYTEVIVRWMEQLAAGLPPIILGDGSQTMDFIDVRDVARANVLALKSSVTDQVFNIGSGTETSLLELAHLLARIMGRAELDPEFNEERRVNPVSRRLADTRKAASMLGFTAAIPLSSGLGDVVQWWRNQMLRAAGRGLLA